MSTRSPSLNLERALQSLPGPLLKRLIKTYSTIKNEALESQYDTIGHQAGKLAEVLVRVLQYMLNGNYTPLSVSLGNFRTECHNIESTPKTAGPEGLRIVMPRALLYLYTLRNKRDFGHTGGEVDANEIDALTAVRIADWCISELVRVSQNIPIEDAQLLCDSIAERRLPAVWNVLGRKRVLDTSLSYRDQVLLLLYSDVEKGVLIEDLFDWTEHSHRSNFRRDVLYKLHQDRLIEWDKEVEVAVLSPMGVRDVESRILPSV